MTQLKRAFLVLGFVGWTIVVALLSATVARNTEFNARLWSVLRHPNLPRFETKDEQVAMYQQARRGMSLETDGDLELQRYLASRALTEANEKK